MSRYSRLVRSIPTAEISDARMSFPILGDPFSWEVTVNGRIVSFFEGKTVFCPPDRPGAGGIAGGIWFMPRRLLRALEKRGFTCPGLPK